MNRVMKSDKIEPVSESERKTGYYRAEYKRSDDSLPVIALYSTGQWWLPMRSIPFKDSDFEQINDVPVLEEISRLSSLLAERERELETIPFQKPYESFDQFCERMANSAKSSEIIKLKNQLSGERNNVLNEVSMLVACMMWQFSAYELTFMALKSAKEQIQSLKIKE